MISAMRVVRRLVAVGWAVTVGLAVPAAGAATVASLCAVDEDPCVIDRTVDLPPSARIDLGERALVVAASGELRAPGGNLTLQAASVTVLQGGRIDVSGGLSTVGGSITVGAGRIEVHGELLASGFDGGRIVLSATGEVIVTGTLAAQGTGVESDGGDVSASAGSVQIAGSVTLSGGPGGFGGVLRIRSAGPTRVGGRIDVSGGEGGDLSVAASGPGAAIDVESGTRLLANATAAGGSGGTVEFLVTGTPGGTLSLRGRIEANGSASATFAGDGGSVFLESSGSLTIADGLTGVTADGGAPDGFGGDITISAGGWLHCGGRIAARGRGSSGLGGSLDISAGDSATFTGLLTVTGPDGGGDIAISVSGTSLDLRSTATVDASSSFSGDGGDISIEGSEATALILSGALFANGGSDPTESSAGDGGSISVGVGTAAFLGLVLAAAGEPSGDGGDIDLQTTAGSLRTSGLIEAAGSGTAAMGGRLAFTSADGLVLDGFVSASGTAGGGIVLAEAAGTLAVEGEIDASGADGAIQLTADDELTVAGSITSDSEISMIACGCRIGTSGVVSATGPQGTINITGLDQIAILGRLTAATGIVLRFDPTDGEPQIAPDASIEGPLVLEPAETPLLCGGCSAGDADGDGLVTDADREALASEFFDGDGDSTSDVGGGTFPGCSGADANGDGRITAADLVARPAGTASRRFGPAQAGLSTFR